MDLDRQIQELIDNAPQDDGTAKGVAAIAPVLKQLASELKHSEYYICQNFNQQWVMTTLSHRTQPELQKNVVYAFANRKDARTFESTPDPQAIVDKLPVTHILFQLIVMEPVDSLIFFDTPGNLTAGTEIHRQQLQKLIQIQLQRHSSAQKGKNSNLPPDIA